MLAPGTGFIAYALRRSSSWSHERWILYQNASRSDAICPGVLDPKYLLFLVLRTACNGKKTRSETDCPSVSSETDGILLPRLQYVFRANSQWRRGT
jgi:hypothetical protein